MGQPPPSVVTAAARARFGQRPSSPTSLNAYFHYDEYLREQTAKAKEKAAPKTSVDINESETPPFRQGSPQLIQIL